MLKNISKLGTILSKSQLKTIQGSRASISADTDVLSDTGGACSDGNWCPVGEICRCADNDCTSGTCEYA
jgi:hypothetical protein